ncbi:enoyl-CoA hydratase/isomerase family protein [Alicyclobacillus cycloheptanicus]|uniref:Enoyl-CoA hydratase/carnithine racemase n=1 Tax=Alicyclobacillus cycloheptanicus TaxID=1457 RepID=A0ABT9XGV3_9BACL|nr:enoyl-CoA hydratase-related protein [Alicyclobacillus cycloheptanicus]MDQ0189539.1 enoyl-CoA hydratase/carnithine racemase [Alicyclobacillus cycloheptanicus]WDM01594.1 enoyl-CoA hydratase/isomerase family protein [Alicyclobacillus cycloheptanicus]
MPHVTWSRREDNPFIAEIVMQREEVLNAFNTQMAAELIEICADITARGDVRVVGLRSSSPRSFCTGADLKERNGMTEQAWRDQHRLFEKMFYAIADLPMPTVAIIDGFCLAGGMELALNCDMWVVSDKAVFGLPEVTRGIMPGGGGTRLLSRRIGVHRAKEMIFTGQKFGAHEVAEMGLVNRIVPSEQLDAAFLEIAAPIAENAPLSVRYCKSAIDELIGYPDDIGRERELAWYNKVIDTEDRHEGIRAFNEKRKPQFQGK